MLKSVKYVWEENSGNIFRIYSIVKYEIIGELRDYKLGIFWNFAGPMIRVFVYWFVFGYILDRGTVGEVEYNYWVLDTDGTMIVNTRNMEIPYLYWMLGGMVVWLFLSPCITKGASAIHSKVNVVKKMKFPVSILPTIVVIKELFHHMCMLVIVCALLIFGGYYPKVQWFGVLYYMFCGVMFAIALAMVTSVLNMLARDTKKFITSTMRLLLYVTPILWSIPDTIPSTLRIVMNLNPIYYIVQGYRDCFFYGKGVFYYKEQMFVFWIITIFLELIGSYMLFRFRYKFVDMI